jgi:hypothetical protein
MTVHRPRRWFSVAGIALTVICLVVGGGAIALVRWLNTPVVEVNYFLGSPDRHHCVLQSKTWHTEMIPFEQTLDICDAKGNQLRNGHWLADCYIENVTWNGAEFSVWDASSTCYWGICYKGKVFWPDDVCSDKGLAELEGCSGVTSLYLSGHRLTDDGIQRLRGLPNLKAVVLDTKGVTRAGIDALQAARPTLEIRSSLLSGKQGAGTQPTSRGAAG